MGAGRLGQKRSKKDASIGDLVVCIDVALTAADGRPKRYIGLVLDKFITVCRIQVVDSGKELYWPLTATYLWKETK